MYDGYLGRTLIDLKLYARGTKWCRTTAWASDGVIEGPESSFGSSKKNSESGTRTLVVYVRGTHDNHLHQFGLVWTCDHHKHYNLFIILKI